MRRAILIAGLLALFCGLDRVNLLRAADQPTPAKPLLLVHYMPWFEADEKAGKWGWHWTMNKIKPEEKDAKGKRKIAAHYYPLIGPYDGYDPDVLEYHVLLMKMAGIDGAIADWYGSEDVVDYGVINRRTGRLIDLLKRRGMKFAICYEDRILKVMIEKTMIKTGQALAHAKDHLRYCQEKWFKDPLYVKWEDRPLLMVFGPDYLRPPQIQTLLAGLQPRPVFLTLHRVVKGADGMFTWPPMFKSVKGVLSQKDLDTFLDLFYNNKKDPLKIGGAFPGFHDFYEQAKERPSYGFLDARKGETFRHTLKRALDANTPIVQVITWNDFGEGTSIEPTQEYEYRYLEILQETRRARIDKDFAYRAADLRLPLRVYQLRKQAGKATAEQTRELDRVVELLYAGDTGKAAKVLDELEKAGK